MVPSKRVPLVSPLLLSLSLVYMHNVQINQAIGHGVLDLEVSHVGLSFRNHDF